MIIPTNCQSYRSRYICRNNRNAALIHMKMTVIKGTYNVFLPERVPWIAQQKFFCHKGAVEPDSTTVTGGEHRIRPAETLTQR